MYCNKELLRQKELGFIIKSLCNENFSKEAVELRKSETNKAKIMLLEKAEQFDFEIKSISNTEASNFIDLFNDSIQDGKLSRIKSKQEKLSKEITGRENIELFRKTIFSLIRCSDYYKAEQNFNSIGKFIQQIKYSILGKAYPYNRKLLSVYSSNGGSGKSFFCRNLVKHLEGYGLGKATPLNLVAGTFANEDASQNVLIYCDEATYQLRSIDEDTLNNVIDNGEYLYKQKYKEAKTLISITNLLLSSNKIISENKNNTRRYDYLFWYDSPENEKQMELGDVRELLLSDGEMKELFHKALIYCPLDYKFEELNSNQVGNNCFNEIYENDLYIKLEDDNEYTITSLRNMFNDYFQNKISSSEFLLWFKKNSNKYFEITRNRLNDINNENATKFKKRIINFDELYDLIPENKTLSMKENIENMINLSNSITIEIDISKNECLPVESNTFYTKTEQKIQNTHKKPTLATQFETLNPMKENLEHRTDEGTISKRNLLFEFDGINIDKQKELIEKNKDKINRCVFSGSKSIHSRITLIEEPESIEEYKYIWKRLNEDCFNNLADRACSNPSRLTRCPNAIRENGIKQELLYKNDDVFFDSSIYKDEWRDLKRKEEEKRELAKLKAEIFADDVKRKVPYEYLYTDEARAILDNDFPSGERVAILSKGIPNLLSAGYSFDEINEHLETMGNKERVNSSLEFSKWFEKKYQKEA